MKIPSKYKIWRYPLLIKVLCFFKNILHRDKVCVTYWINANTYIWDAKIKHFNWGDYVNLQLAKMISGKTIIPSIYCSFAPKVAMVGSILPWAMDSETIVWGSGCLNSHDPMWNNIEKPRNVCAVRGPLTRSVLLRHGIECPEVYGDPVLLFPRYYNPMISKSGKIGIVPHVSSINMAICEELCKKNKNIMIINPVKFSTWHEFIDKIVSCRFVLSSSLHGIIVADAYHVPNVWVSFREDEHPDNNFKFHDYFSSVGKQEIKQPIAIKNFDFEEVGSYIAKWKEPLIDLDKLYEACPIKQQIE